jgi:ADP-heptose:LPS heptosyltransferase
MKLKFMRVLDVYLGEIFFAFINFLFLFKFNKSAVNPNPEKVNKILVIKFFGLGSILLMTPMVRGLRTLYPHAKIYFLTFKHVKKFCGQVSGFDEVLTLRDDNFLVFAEDALKSLLFIWKNRPNIVVDAEFFSNFTSLFSFFTFSPVRVGFHMRQAARGVHLTHKVVLNTHHHIVYGYYALAAALGGQYEDLNFKELDLNSPSRKTTDSVLNKLNFKKSDKLIVINPNASPTNLLRRWPADYFISLISQLALKYLDYYFVLIGNKNEEVYVNDIFENLNLPNVFSSVGQLNIDEYLALLNQSELIITNDSLPVHIASAYKKSVAVFFGPETPVCYGPLGKNALVFYSNIPCSPCILAFDNKEEVDCKDNICLKKITPEYALKRIEEKFFVD